MPEKTTTSGWSQLREAAAGRDAAAPASTPRYRFPAAGLTAVVTYIVVLISWMVWDTHQLILLHTYGSAANMVAALEHDIDGTIELYNLSLEGVIDRLSIPELANASPQSQHRILFDGASAVRNLSPLLVVDEVGRVRFESHPRDGSAANFSDRDFFKAQQADPTLGLYISAPFVDPASQAPSVAFSRRLPRPDGSFAGIVFGVVRLDFFAELFRRVDPGAAGSVALTRADGVVIYRTPAGNEPAGKAGSSDGFPDTAQEPFGLFEAVSPRDGVERIYAFQKVGGLPLVLRVGIARDTAFATWRQKTSVVVGATVGFTLLVAILGAALASELRRSTRAERRAVDNYRRYRVLADNSLDMIVRINPREQKLVYASPACRRLYGYEPDEMLAVGFGELVHPDDRERVRCAFAKEEPGAWPPLAYRGRRKDGSSLWLEANLTQSRDPDGGAPEITGVVRDISERVRYEAELQDAKEKADAANNAKSNFLSVVTHELRTPLNAIIGFAEIIDKEMFGPIANQQYKSYISDIYSSGNYLLNLVNDILDLSKAEAGKLELFEGVFDVGETMQSVRRLCRPQLEAGNLVADVDVTADLPLLRADERKTRQVLFNLIGNAAKFTPSGGQITITARLDPDRGIVISVADTGIGIAPEELELALQPYVQLERSFVQNPQGTGLGLALVKAIMELHGGSLELKSAVGKGTEAVAVFPLERAVARA